MSDIQMLREFIEREVFTRGSEQSIFPESPWIMDFRRVCLDPKFLDAYTEVFFERFKDRYPFQIGGMEVAAIPLVAAIVMKMRERGMPINGFFIRKSRKKTGLLKMIEGKVTDDPVILVDDLINNGYTLDRQLKVLAETGCVVKSFFTVLRFRDVAAYRKYTEAGIAIDSLFSLDQFHETLGTELHRAREAVSQESFSVKWHFKERGAKLEMVIPKSGVVLDEEKMYFGTDQGAVYALRKSDGGTIWKQQVSFWVSKRRVPGILSTPALLEGRLYTAAYDGNIHCLDAATGRRLWVSFDADHVQGSPAVSSKKGVVYVPVLYELEGRRGGVLALDARTGKVLWRAQMAPALRSTPLLVESEQKLFVGSEDGTLFALDMETGRELWNFRAQGAIKSAPIYDAETQCVITASLDGAMYVLRARDGLVLWTHEGSLSNYSAPCLWRDRVFFTSLDKHLYCLDHRSGERLWVVPARARIFCSPRVYRDRLYFGANDARMYVLDPLTGKQIGFFQAVERITNPVVFDEKTGDFFLQTYANEILCLREKD